MFFQQNNDTELYHILNLDKNCSEKDIKISYKKLAMKYHPDRYKGDNKEDNENKFKEISRAYSILSNKEKREMYDKYGEEGLNNNITEQPNFSNMDPFGWNIFENLYKESKKKTEDRIETINIKLKDIYNEKHLNLNYEKDIICNNCNGLGVNDINLVTNCISCNGSGYILKIVHIGPGMISQSQNICEQCKGSGKYNDYKNICSYCNGNKTVKHKTKLKLKLTRTMKQGGTIKYVGESDQHPDVEIYGDLIIKLNIIEDSRFKIYKHKHLIYEKTISVMDALCDVDFCIEHLDKRLIKVKYNDVIYPNCRKIIKGEGLSGDLIIKFNIEFPKKIDSERKEYLRKILEIYNDKKNLENSDVSNFSAQYILEDYESDNESENLKNNYDDNSNTNNFQEKVECNQQ